MTTLRAGDTVRITRDIRVTTMFGLTSRVAIHAGSVGVVTSGPGMWRKPVVRFDGGVTFDVNPESLQLVEGAGQSRYRRW